MIDGLSAMSTRFGGLVRRIIRKKRDLALVAFWTALISLIIIRVYLFAYSADPYLAYIKPPYPFTGSLSPDLTDMLIIGAAGIVVGLFLSDVQEMIYGYVATISLSFITGVIFVSFYIWYELGWGTSWSSGYNWEWAPFLATEVVFALMVPWVIISALLSLIIGAFLKDWIR
jgi:hypothetical protein